MEIGPVAATLLSIMAIASALLLIGGVKLARDEQNPRRGVLMIVAGLVMAGNVLIWTWPAP
jgi:hypothetical protein